MCEAAALRFAQADDVVYAGASRSHDDGEVDEPEHTEDISMPFRPRAPKAYRRKGRLLDHPNYHHSDPDQMSMEGWCNVRYKWLSLHAGVAIKGEDRDGLKRLFRYAARSSVAVSQLSYVTPEDPDRSDVALKLKRTWRDGTGSLVFTQRDFVEKLASLVPPPWFNCKRSIIPSGNAMNHERIS